MWNQKTDALFLEMRQDAVLIFDKKHMKLQYLNPAAKILFPDAGPDRAPGRKPAGIGSGNFQTPEGRRRKTLFSVRS